MPVRPEVARRPGVHIRYLAGAILLHGRPGFPLPGWPTRLLRRGHGALLGYVLR